MDPHDLTVKRPAHLVTMMGARRPSQTATHGLRELIKVRETKMPCDRCKGQKPCCCATLFIERFDTLFCPVSLSRDKSCENRGWPNSIVSADPPIRESLLRLEQENLVTVQPRQGYRVNPISITDVEEVFALRLLIEPVCAAAAALADDTVLRALDRFRGFVDQDLTEAQFFEYSVSFHGTIAELSGNKRFAAVALELDQPIRASGASRRWVLEHRAIRCFCAEHEAIITALQAHDPDRASRLSYEHVESARERITTALPGSRRNGNAPAPPGGLAVRFAEA